MSRIRPAARATLQDTDTGAKEKPTMETRFEGISQALQLFFRGEVPQAELWRRITRMKSAMTERALDHPDRSWPSAIAVLELIDLLLHPAFPAVAPDPVLRVLHRIEERVRRGQSNIARQVLPLIFSQLGHLRLCALQNPLEGTQPESPPRVDSLEPPSIPGVDGPEESGSGGFEDQWVDVGLLRSVHADPNPNDVLFEEQIKLIPFSVFTQRFFYGVLPELLGGAFDDEPGFPPLAREDAFFYHPENDQAIVIVERHPRLATPPCSFRYFIGETGLAEIVLDVPRIGKRELLFAAQLFCLRNSVRRATLDGRRVVGFAPGSQPKGPQPDGA